MMFAARSRATCAVSHVTAGGVRTAGELARRRGWPSSRRYTACRPSCEGGFRGHVQNTEAIEARHAYVWGVEPRGLPEVQACDVAQARQMRSLRDGGEARAYPGEVAREGLLDVGRSGGAGEARSQEEAEARWR